MGKKIGDSVTIRSAAAGSKDCPDYISVAQRTTHTDIITKVFSHGVRTKSSGYVNNKRIISYESIQIN